MIGTTISHFYVKSKLGAGGMGVVYRAEDHRLGRPVALKVLPPDLAGDEERRARFIREARTAAAVSHRNIATIYEVDEADGIIFIAMELIEGESLAEKLNHGRLDRKQVVALGLQIAEALTVAHRSNVIHRDLKPDNVMVDLEGDAKILDFGLAKLLEPHVGGKCSDVDTVSADVTREGRIVGTAAYMSPEQARGLAMDSRSDLFSLGIMLYEMATGVHPFRGTTSMDALTAIIKENPQPPGKRNPHVQPELQRVILKCLEKDPDERYQHADEVVVNLRRLASISGSRPTPSYQLSVRRRWIVPFVAVLVIAALGTVTVLVVTRRDAPAPLMEAQVVKPTVAVLPFRNLSAEQENEYFADGITVEIISKLSRIAGLEVSSASSVTRFKGTEKNLKQVGEELGVQYVLEGSVRKAGNRVRIVAQLVDANTGFELWSDDFNADLKDIFGVQEQTALKIAEALDLRLSPQEQRAIERGYTDSPEAFDAFLRGRALVEFFSSAEKLSAARENFERALELDPNYPLALVGLSRVETQFHRNIDPDPKRLERAEELIQRALAEEPDFAEAHVAIGELHGNRFDYEHAVESFREALRIDPDHAHAWDLLSWALAYLQPPKAEEAEEAARKAIRLQPPLIGAYYHLGRALLLQGRHDEAIDAFQQARQLDHGFQSAIYGIGQVYLEQDKPDKALEEFKKLTSNLGSPVIQAAVASAHSAQGDHDSALRHLERALQAGYRDFAALQANRHLQVLRSDPRYAALIERYAE